MSKPAKDEAELIRRMEEKSNWDSEWHYQIAPTDALAAIRAAGWAVVPVEPTEEMLNCFSEPNGYICSLDWEAILAASPIPPGVKS